MVGMGPYVRVTDLDKVSKCPSPRISRHLMNSLSW